MIAGQTSRVVVNINLDTGSVEIIVNWSVWNILRAIYNDISIPTQAEYPYGITFNPDGTKMYESGRNPSGIFQYSLSTAWDLSTATYDSKSVASQSTYPDAVQFKPDGLAMYELLYGGPGVIFQYTLTTAWDVSTASYADKDFSTSSQTGNQSMGLFFSSDGTKMYVSSGETDGIYQYSLSTAWDVSTASYDSVSIPSQSNWPNGIYFSPDGIKMYESGNDPNMYIYQYSLSTAWDLLTATYDNAYTDVESQGAPDDLFFKPDGTRMYIIGGGNIDEYNLQ